jgi:uncharacterized protein (TIGR03437 family)
VRDGQQGNVVTFQVAERAARILVRNFGGTDYGVITHNSDGALAWPSELGGRPPRTGDVVVAWVFGAGQSTPPVASGQPAPAQEPLARIVPTPTAFFGAGLTGGVPVVPAFVGMAGNLAGVYQVNVVVPGNAPRGDAVPFRIEGPGILSNQVFLAIE